MNRLQQIWVFLSQPKVYWRIFSLLLAMTFWLLAAGDGSLSGTERITTIAVEVQNLPSDLALVGSPEMVRVRIRGLSPILNRGEDSLVAKIDLSGAEEGSETYAVDVEAPLGIEVVTITPRWVNVYTEQVTEAVFPVTLALLGVDSSKVVTGLNAAPSVVTVRGPRSTLEEIDHVVAHLSLDSLFEEKELLAPVQALDFQGRGLFGLEIEPREIVVSFKQSKEASPVEEEGDEVDS